MVSKARGGDRAAESADDVLRAVREGGPGTYVVLGDNGLDQDEVVATVVAELAPEPMRAFNYDAFHAGERECTPETIANAVQAYPVMADVRVVVVRGLEDAREDVGNELARLAARIPGTILLLVGEKLDNRRKWVAALGANASTFTLATPRGRGFTGWLRRRARKQGVELDEAAADLIVDYVGPDVYRAASELEKVAVFVAPKTAIGVPDVEAVVGITREDTIYNLTDLVAEMKVAEALRVARRMVQADQHPAYIVGMIVRNWQRLRIAGDLVQAGRDRDLGGLIGENRTFILQKLVAQARALRRERIRTGFRLALMAESAIKDGRPADVVLDGLICQLASSPAGRGPAGSPSGGTSRKST